MSIAERRSRRYAGAAVATLAWLLLSLPLQAHPVAQGGIDVDIRGRQVRLDIRVSQEEMDVRAAYAQETSLAPRERARRHARYLLDHVRLMAGGTLLSGTVDRQPTGDPRRFRLDFERPEALDPGASLSLSQDVLREFDYVPGNPWEASYLVSVRRDGVPVAKGLLLRSVEPLLLDGSRPAVAVAGPVDGYAFMRHGLLHILEGYDHLLFVIALVLAVRSLYQLLLTITAFTLAHGLTLGLTALGWITPSPRVVEPMIAGSILVMALLTLLRPGRPPGRLHLLLAAGFGLFHGMGFAGGLAGSLDGLATHSLLLAIAWFSLGVELGQQLVVLPAFALLWTLQRSRHQGQLNDLRRYTSGLISLAGSYYLWSALNAALVR